jgi:hypothetical protein
MQHLQRLASVGHYFWTADRIAVVKLPGFIAKWQPQFHLRADAAARAYRKRSGRASVQLCLHPDALGGEEGPTAWWMMSTAGKEGLLGPGPLPGPVRDGRTAEGRLRCGDYELLQQPKTFRDKSRKVKTVTTWTWRIQPMRYREWEALLVERARARDSQCVATAFDALQAMPMFAGIRAQIIALARETNKVLAKVGMASFVLSELPIVRMIQLWSDGGEL